MAERKDKKGRKLNSGEYQRSDGSYMFRYRSLKNELCYVYSWKLTPADTTPSGKKDGKSLREMEQEINREIIKGIDSRNAKRTSVNDLFAIFIDSKYHLKLSTLNSYRGYYKRYIENEIGREKISNITYSSIKKLYKKYDEKYHLSVKTIKTIHSIMKMIFDIAVKDDLIVKNPTFGAYNDIKKFEKWEIREEKYISEEDQHRFFRYVENDDLFNYYSDLLYFMLGTGCRVGEVAALQWEDIDFKNNIIKINKTLTTRTGQEAKMITLPKTRTSIRNVPMFPSVRAILQKMSNDKIPCTETVDGYNDFVFVTKFNRTFTPTTIGNVCTKAVYRFNKFEESVAKIEKREPKLLPKISPHWFRHTFSTRLNNQNINPKVIQSILGHSSINTTMNVYVAATDEIKMDAIKNTFDFCEC